jgi:hypothetical protein
MSIALVGRVALVVYLASDTSEMISVHDLVIDGGQLAKP